MIVLCQRWEESEKGWGVRPTGYSLHLTEDDLKEYIKLHWGTYVPPRESPPDEYERPAGLFYCTKITSEVYNKLLRSKKSFGLSFNSRQYPEVYKGV